MRGHRHPFATCPRPRAPTEDTRSSPPTRRASDNVLHRAEVDEMMNAAREAGARIVKDAQNTFYAWLRIGMDSQG